MLAGAVKPYTDNPQKDISNKRNVWEYYKDRLHLLLITLIKSNLRHWKLGIAEMHQVFKILAFQFLIKFITDRISIFYFEGMKEYVGMPGRT